VPTSHHGEIEMNISARFCIAILVVCLAIAGTQAADVPSTVGYQGRLYDVANQPINNTLPVVFALYPAASGGTPVWTETQNVVFSNGYFSVQLGSVTVFNANAFDGTPRFLGVAIGADPEMEPRAAIASVPYALSAKPDARFGVTSGTAAAGTGRTCTLGEIILSAGTVANGTPAAGQIVVISQNTALFSLLGTMYGGDGNATFALPDLRAVAPNGLTYSICTVGNYPSTR